MSQGTATADAQGAAAGEGAGSPDTSAQGAASTTTAQGAGADEGVATVEALSRKITDLERDNRAYRKREQDRERADREAQDQGKTEVERLRSENERLTKDLSERDARDRSRSLQMASLSTAQRLGFRNPELASKLLRADDPDVEWDAEGNPKNVEKLLKAFAEANPYAVTSTDFGGGNRGASAASGTPDMNALIRQAAGKSGG